MDFPEQILLHCLDAADAEDVVRHQRAFDERLTFADKIAGVYAHGLAVGAHHPLQGLDQALGVSRPPERASPHPAEAGAAELEDLSVESFQLAVEL